MLNLIVCQVSIFYTNFPNWDILNIYIYFATTNFHILYKKYKLKAYKKHCLPCISTRF